MPMAHTLTSIAHALPPWLAYVATAAATHELPPLVPCACKRAEGAQTAEA